MVIYIDSFDVINFFIQGVQFVVSMMRGSGFTGSKVMG